MVGMDEAKRKRIRSFVDELRALSDEPDKAFLALAGPTPPSKHETVDWGSPGVWLGPKHPALPLEEVRGLHDLTNALEEYLSGNALPIRRWLDLDAPARSGVSGRTVEQRRKILKKVEELQAKGATLEEAAPRAGADPKTVRTWRQDPRWIAEELTARLDRADAGRIADELAARIERARPQFDEKSKGETEP